MSLTTTTSMSGASVVVELLLLPFDRWLMWIDWRVCSVDDIIIRRPFEEIEFAIRRELV